jgi:hypothetical protein
MPLTNNKANQEKQDEREAWHKLVVKIISWKNRLPESVAVLTNDLISKKEWDKYCKGTVKINANVDKKVMMKRLEEIRARIESFGGFSNN